MEHYDGSLLPLPNPLEIVREQWLEQENEDREAILGRVLRSVQAQGSERDHGPKMAE